MSGEPQIYPTHCCDEWTEWKILVKKSGFLKTMHDFDWFWSLKLYGSSCIRVLTSPCIFRACHGPQQTLRPSRGPSWIVQVHHPNRGSDLQSQDLMVNRKKAGVHQIQVILAACELRKLFVGGVCHKTRKGNIYGIWLFCFQVSWHGWSCKAKTTSTNDGESIVKDHSKHTRLVRFFLT